MDSDESSLNIHLCQAMPNCNGIKSSESQDFMEEFTCTLKGIKVGIHVNFLLDTYAIFLSDVDPHENALFRS